MNDTPLVSGEATRLGLSVGADIALSDQSHGRVRLAIEGPAATRILASGCALDLTDAGLPLGRSAQTLFRHVGIHVTRTGPERYELIVLQLRGRPMGRVDPGGGAVTARRGRL